ncbi:MAG: S49 family peptidase, partial [Candidatus Cloacimonetes bacterium]|nr:S49 family peptidase [Candidatus Cloacimonadota bacterium]
DFASTSRTMTESEKQLFQQTISDSYEQFVEYVARARNLDKAAVHEVAQGRVWTGRQALERGLIDELGGMDRAVQSLQEMAGLVNKAELLDYTEKSGFELRLGGEFGSLFTEILLPEDIEWLEKNLQKFKLLEKEKILKVIPYDLEIK